MNKILKNDSTFTFKLPKELRDEFNLLISTKNYTASQIMREWMSDYIKNESSGVSTQNLSNLLDEGQNLLKNLTDSLEDKHE